MLGLVAVVISVLVALRVGRTLVRRLSGVRTAALELAEHRLPDVVARLRRGEQVDVAREAPPLEYGDDEIGEVGRAFTEVQRTAVRAAVDEVTLRRGLNEVFLNIARRSQSLVHRQLRLLDRMERRARTRTSWRTCSGSTTWPPGCAGTPRTWSSSPAPRPAGAGATRSRWST